MEAAIISIFDSLMWVGIAAAVAWAVRGIVDAVALYLIHASDAPPKAAPVVVEEIEDADDEFTDEETA